MSVTVPFMVDARRSPIDFKRLDAAHIEECATSGKCGICGRKIRRGPIAFIGPNDGRSCFGDPWVHPSCAQSAMTQCPFLSGQRDWSSADDRNNPLLAPFSAGMAVVLARNWRAHRDAAGAWHFQAIGVISRE